MGARREEVGAEGGGEGGRGGAGSGSGGGGAGGAKMAYQTFRQEYLQVPPVTRAYTTACVLTTAAVVRGAGGVSKGAGEAVRGMWGP